MRKNKATNKNNEGTKGIALTKGPKTSGNYWHSFLESIQIKSY